MKRLIMFILFTPLILLAGETNSVIKSRSLLPRESSSVINISSIEEVGKDDRTTIVIPEITTVDIESKTEIEIVSILAESLVNKSYIEVARILDILFETKTEVEIESILSQVKLSNSNISLYDLFKEGKLHWVVIHMKESKISGNESEYELMKIKFNELLDQWINKDLIK